MHLLKIDPFLRALLVSSQFVDEFRNYLLTYNMLPHVLHRLVKRIHLVDLLHVLFLRESTK